MFISQSKYAKELVKKLDLDNKKHTKIPMSTSVKLNMDSNGKNVDHTLYRSMIGSLLYLTASRPNLSFSVGICARFQSDPKESHLEAVKKVIRYINGTVNFGILYSYKSNSHLAGFFDADWAGNCDDCKSTSDWMLLYDVSLNNNPRGGVNWVFKNFSPFSIKTQI